jgi:uncharacterized membrane protein
MQAIMARLDGLLVAMEEVDTNNARALRKDVMEYLQSIGAAPMEEDAVAAEAQGIAAQTQPAPQALPEAPPQPTPNAPMPVEETASVGVGQ